MRAWIFGIAGSLCAVAAWASEYDRQAHVVAEAMKLQGTWELDTREEAGEARRFKGRDTKEEPVLSITGTAYLLMTFHREPGIDALPSRDEGRFKLVPGKKGAIDILMEGSKERRGIYEFEGDVLRICTSPPGEKGRPKSFKTKGTSNTLEVFVRRRGK
jgi:uncharacterized protein (TIGR03067 family)